jgi:Zn-dependent peptidase ImmA (M78 family)
MNTVAKGNNFESLSYDIIETAVKEGKLGIHSDQCKIFKKKGYFSRDRNKDIIFDLSIEVWPPSATNYSLLYLIECKNYSHPVPVNDPEEFYAKITQVSGANAKAVFITNSEFQEGAYNFAKSKGMMLIQVNYDESHKILLYKIQRNKTYDSNSKLESWDEVLESFFKKVFSQHSKITGLAKLTQGMIENTSREVLSRINPNILKAYTNLHKTSLIEYINTVCDVKTDFSNILQCDENGNRILGYFDSETRTIHIDATLYNTNRFLFVLAHELGHLTLHDNLKINQNRYNQFKDPEYNFMMGKYELKNEKNWIEWQANQFAAALIMPKESILFKLISYQNFRGIRNVGTMYYDDQPINRRDFFDTITYLSNYFDVSFTSLRYRLAELEILKDGRSGVKHWTNYFKELYVINGI